jgi:hypothetical protein
MMNEVKEILEYLGRWINENKEAITAIATLAIAIFTYTLWRSTEKLWKATNATIELTRQEFLSEHRPKLIVRGVSINETKAVGGIHDILAAQYTIANVGDTAATIIETSDYLWLPTKGENLPPIPEYADGKTVSIKIEAGSSIPIKHYGTPELLKEFALASGAALKPSHNVPVRLPVLWLSQRRFAGLDTQPEKRSLNITQHLIHRRRQLHLHSPASVPGTTFFVRNFISLGIPHACRKELPPSSTASVKKFGASPMRQQRRDNSSGALL